MAERIIGIDLGTTNSEVAILEDGQPRIIEVDGSTILPSMVGFNNAGELIVGIPARNQYAMAPDRTIRSIKRKMGEEVKVPLGDQSFTPAEISAMILKRLKQAAEADLGETVNKAVITVPAYFNDTQRQATREAGELAGLEVVRIINEPTAAALTYSPAPDSSERILVYDLGGGTFDVSILQSESGIYEVLSSHGDTQLGGDDFDDLLLDHVADEFQASFNVDLRADPATRNRLNRAVEQAKRTLSEHPVARLEEEFIAEHDGVPLHLSTELTRETFNSLIEPLLEKTLHCLQQALDDANLTASQIDRVVLVGGSTRSPIVSALLEDRLGQPIHGEVHPDLCVAMGAAVQAGIIAGEDVKAVLVDITPHSLGIRTMDMPMSFLDMPDTHRFAVIVKRNTPLPAMRSEMFCTVSDMQPAVDVEVYQGESSDVRQNHRVGKFIIEGLAKVPAGNQILVELKLTLDGTLEVSAREKSTGLMKKITIDSAVARNALTNRNLSRERLDELWRESGSVSDAPIADSGPAEGARERIQAEALLDKAKSLREGVSDEDKTELDRHDEAIRHAITDRNWDKLRTATAELSDMLFYLEDE